MQASDQVQTMYLINLFFQIQDQILKQKKLIELQQQFLKDLER